MIKFAIQTHQNRFGYPEVDYADKDTTEPPTEGAVLEEWAEEETRYIRAHDQSNLEARIDANGKPYIHATHKYSPEESYDKWCKRGHDHTQEKIDTESPPHWVYTRKLDRSVWTLTVETLEKMEELLDYEYDMGLIWNNRPNGIKYYLEI